MTALRVLAADTCRESLRGRFWQLSLVFGAVTLYLSLVLGLLAADQELRVIEDFGLALIELLGVAGAVHGAATVYLREMETKTLYLILARPVGRGQYLLGRFAGLLLAAAASMALMGAAHLLLLFAKGWSWHGGYAWALLGAWLKVLVTTAAAAFLAVFSSSALTAMVIAAVLWALGHFLPEIRFMIRWGSEAWSMAPLHLLSYIIPDLQLFNLRDRLTPLPGAAPEAALWKWLAYAAAYSACWLAAARQLLKKREF